MMARGWIFWRRQPLLALVAIVVTGCGGGTSAPVVNLPPAPAITTPADGTLVRAGETLSVAVSGTDPEDGTLPAAQLSWWIDLHHDDHAHPFQLPTTGFGMSVSLPTRGETSENIWYRIHVRATDSGGLSAEASRDIFPRKSKMTFATVPTGLQLTLDGQAVTAPTTVVGVVGMERDLAAPDQDAAGKRYRFVGWSDAGKASHTVSTPETDTTYSANFAEIGPAANVPPTVVLSAPGTGALGLPIALSAVANDVDGTVQQVEFLDGSTLLGTDVTAPYGLNWTPVAAGPHTLMARATDNTGATALSKAVVVSVTAAGDASAPSVQLFAPANLADGLSGTLLLQATASDDVGVAAVQFEVDGVRVAEDLLAPYTSSVDTAAYASGQHVVRARARDAAGNFSAWSTSTVRFAGVRGAPAGFTVSEGWASGAGSGTAFVQAPDGRFFVAVQDGRLLVVKNGALLSKPFLTVPVDSTGERGLLGVALHPNFASNGWLYVYHTRINGSQRNNRISRFVASGDVSTGTAMASIDLPNVDATNHNGGAMRFGPDGKLYVSVGDNATGTKAQDLNDPFGKILRFNDDLSIPADNPFCTTPGKLACAAWAYGLRNPFTFAFQPGTGRMHINDVGQNTWEEINLGAARANYGWPGSEGPNNVGAGITAPLFAYRHSNAVPAGSGLGGFFIGKAIVGGTFYPSNGPFPVTYRGKYFFADYVNRWVGVLDVANGNAAYAFANVNPFVVDMLVGVDGALYVLGRSVPDQLGFDIVRISPS